MGHEYTHVAQHKLLKENPTEPFSETIQFSIIARSFIDGKNGLKVQIDDFKQSGREKDLETARRVLKQADSAWKKASSTGLVDGGKYFRMGFSIKLVTAQELAEYKKLLGVPE